MKSELSNMAERTKQKPTQEPTSETEFNSCGECGGQLITSEKRSETYCSDCGAVVDANKIDHGPEWRSFDDSKKEPSRGVGSPITPQQHDWGLSTQISRNDFDYRGNQISSSEREKFSRLRKRQKWETGGRNQSRTLKNCLAEIIRMGTALGIPDNTVDMSCMLMRNIVSEDFMPGNSIESVSTAVLYANCRINNISRSLDEMAEVSRVSRKEFRQTYQHLLTELSLEIPPANPNEYIPRFCSNIGLPNEIEREAKKLSENYREETNTSGMAPTTIAASSIYAAGIKLNIIVPQKLIAEVSSKNKETIRTRYREVLVADSDVDMSNYLNDGRYRKHPVQIVRDLHDVETANWFDPEDPDK